jgi:SpoU rRNA methylase family enzyme
MESTRSKIFKLRARGMMEQGRAALLFDNVSDAIVFLNEAVALLKSSIESKKRKPQSKSKNRYYRGAN